MTRDLILIGGGELARVIIDAAQSRPEQWRVIGFLDAQPCDETTQRFHVERLGDIEDFNDTAHHILGIGAVRNPGIRMQLVDRHPHAQWATIIHRDATIAGTAVIERGAFIGARAVINTGARIGRHCVVASGAVIDHDATLGDFTHVAPNAAVGGGATIGKGCYLTIGSRVVDHTKIDDRTVL